MSTMKTRIQGLSLLDRALTAMTDDELTALIDSLPDDHREALDSLCGARDGGFEDPAARIVALRATAARGRMSGGLEQIATVLGIPPNTAASRYRYALAALRKELKPVTHG